MTALAILAAVSVRAEEADSFSKYCDQVGERYEKVEHVVIDKAMFRVAKMFMSKEERRLMTELGVTGMELLDLEKCSPAQQAEIIKGAREMLSKAPYKKLDSEKKGGGEIYCVESSDGKGLSEIAILICSGKPGLSRMTGDIRPEKVGKLTL